MEYFQRIVLGLALIMLIIANVVILYTTTSKSKPWSPTMSTCPDYWQTSYTADGKKITCTGPTNSFEYPIGSTCQTKIAEITKLGAGGNVDWEGVTYGINPGSCK